MTTMNIPDFSGVSTAVEKPNTNGRAAAASSRPTVLSNEDLAAINSLATLLASIDGHVDQLEGYTDGLETLITATNTALGTANTSLSNISAAALDTTTDSPVATHQPCDVVSFTPTLDTAAYAAGDVLFATAAISLARANDLQAMLASLTAIDKSKQKPAMTIFFYQTNVTSAAANAANNLSDADAINCLGYVRLLAADWIDLANNSFLCYSGAKGPNLLLKPATGTTNVYAVGILDAGTPTFAVGDIALKLGVVQR